MGNSHNSDRFKDFAHSKAGRLTTGQFSKTKAVIYKEKEKILPKLPEIYKEIFSQDKLRNTTGYMRKRPRLNDRLSKSLDMALDRSTSADDSFKPRGSLEYELTIKSADDLRRSYMAKLIYKNIWQPTIEEKKHNSIIIFDWDDTLLPTTFLTPNGIFTDESSVDEVDLEKIRGLEPSVYKILELAISKGDVYIITNAAPGWVEYSTRTFYPKVKRLLNNITIVSARGAFEKIHPGDSRQWKIQAFLDMLKNLDINLITNLLCLGDSLIEMEAAQILYSRFTHAYIKTIKFRETPQPEELYKQLSLVINQFEKIFSSVKNLTIKVDKKPKNREEK
jgi:hypothetical protein